jgi:hypothetical protein
MIGFGASFSTMMSRGAVTAAAIGLARAPVAMREGRRRSERCTPWLLSMAAPTTMRNGSTLAKRTTGPRQWQFLALATRPLTPRNEFA